MLALDTIEATDARYDLAKHELIVPRLKLANGTFAAALSADGTLNWQSLFKENPRAKSAQKKGASSPFHARAEAIAIDNVGLRYTDHTRATPLDYAAALHADTAGVNWIAIPIGVRVARRERLIHRRSE